MKRTPQARGHAEVPPRLHYSHLLLEVLENRLPPGDLLLSTALGASLLGLWSRPSSPGAREDVLPVEHSTGSWAARPVQAIAAMMDNATPAPAFRVSSGDSQDRSVETSPTPVA